MKTRLCAVTIAALVALGLKQHYSVARADDLWWMLGPTTALVEIMTGTAFTMAPDEGYVSRERLFLIDKSCAGINFLIAAFAMLVFVRRQDIASCASAARTLVVALSTSYGATLIVNALRISIAMGLADTPTRFAAFDPAEVHRLEGIAVYFAGLLALYECARWSRPRAVPLRSSR
jgi:exosortase K